MMKGSKSDGPRKAHLSLFQAFRIALIFFCVAAGFGLVMRLAFSADLPEWIDYTYIKHAHSHVALLGWLFAAFYLLIILVWNLSWKEHILLYGSTQVATIGMLVTFPITGYGILSILFSTLHILLTYLVVWKIWKGLKGEGLLPEWCLKASLIFLVIATLGTWSLGPIMGTFKGSAFYYAAIQWYLHFMFNGWMIFAMLAIFFKYVTGRKIQLDITLSRLFFGSLTISTILTYALAVTWSTPLPIIFLVNSVGVLLQLMALFLLFRFLSPVWNKVLRTMSSLSATLIRITMMALVLKILIQAAVVLPFIAKISYTIKNFVVGFVHLLMLGCLTIFIIAMISELLKVRFSKMAVWLMIIGIVSTEILLFVQGLMLWLQKGFMSWYYNLMSACSILIVMGVCWVTATMKKRQDLK